jgi:uncharacterized membrane protein required for colicin V production
MRRLFVFGLLLGFLLLYAALTILAPIIGPGEEYDWIFALQHRRPE